MVNPMTIGDVLGEGSKRLKENCHVPWLDASVILGYVLGKERWYLVAHDRDSLSMEEKALFFSLIDKRSSGVPVQYITGCQEFMSLEFLVNPTVLIPRPETEMLVEEVLGFISLLPQNETVLAADIGTGSGCIAVSIAKNSKNTLVKAFDISQESLEVARKNAQRLGVSDKVEFVQSNLFENIGKDKFDVIVSNPPYIPTEVIKTLQPEVKEHEPRLALDGGSDGLLFYSEIVRTAFLHLKPGGMLALEIGWNQGRQLEVMVRENENYFDFYLNKDLSGKDRIVTARRKN